MLLMRLPLLLPPLPRLLALSLLMLQWERRAGRWLCPNPQGVQVFYACFHADVLAATAAVECGMRRTYSPLLLLLLLQQVGTAGYAMHWDCRPRGRLALAHGQQDISGQMSYSGATRIALNSIISCE